MKKKSLIVSGALALSLLAAPASSLASAGDNQGFKVETESFNIEGVYDWVNKNEEALKTNNIQAIDIQSLLDQMQQGTQQPAEADEKPQAEEQPAEAPAEQPQAEEQPAEAPVEQPQAEEQPAEQPAEEQSTQESAPQEETTEQADEGSEVSAFEQQVVELTNEERAKQGLEPLELDTELSAVAKDKSIDMQQNNYFSHDSPTHGSPFDMMNAYGIDYTTAGENIAMGQTSPEEVVQGWMNSQGHRENIMNSSFTHIGVGHTEDGNYWTQMFIAK
ncbi:CAP domain-containing protein [Halobacillus sp. A1]|uniref:CAP domain-containing protein n=1 Tax=Halobacillus sp. A1 TaxID=2880262 RepID=UPI0020A6922B|nr:CAP domain-containing protein [Halobacillus sp. A1]MCP3029968.1 CAP domain-containing protein [Halobacillus sp. A1]